MVSSFSDLDQAASSLVRAGITPNSRATYAAAVRKYISFCRQYQLRPLPVSHTNALRFVAYCAGQGLAVSTVRVYLAGLRSWSIDSMLPPPNIYTPQLVQAIRALERHHNPAQAAPLFYHHLLSFFYRIPFNLDNLMSMAAISLAYFACLRPSEYLATRGTSRAPLRKDVVFAEDFKALDFMVPSSKTNPKGFTVHLGCSAAPLCPVCLIKAIFTLLPLPPSSPLFITPFSAPMSYASLTKKLHGFLTATGLHPAPFSLHSLRAGAATTAAAVGCSEHEVQRLGRWASQCYRRYIRPSRAHQAAMTPRLATSIH